MLARPGLNRHLLWINETRHATITPRAIFEAYEMLTPCSFIC